MSIAGEGASLPVSSTLSTLMTGFFTILRAHLGAFGSQGPVTPTRSQWHAIFQCRHGSHNVCCVPFFCISVKQATLAMVHESQEGNLNLQKSQRWMKHE
jgi:hypothetical protein